MMLGKISVLVLALGLMSFQLAQASNSCDASTPSTPAPAEPLDPWDLRDHPNPCCSASDPVDSNMCFDSWEEFEEACLTPVEEPSN